MRNNQEKFWHRSIFVIFCCYTIPVALLVLLYAKKLPLITQWSNFLIGLLLVVTGTLILFLRVESPRQSPVPIEPTSAPVPVAEPLPIDEDEVQRLEKIIEDLKEKWHEKKVESEEAKRALEEFREESGKQKLQADETLRKKDSLLSEYAQTVNDLRSNMGQKQDQIDKLQESIHDLNYDLDTLINLSKFDGEKPTPQPLPKEVEKVAKPTPSRLHHSKISGLEEAQRQLKKCINMAQKLSSNQFGTSRYLLDNTALDKRRLFDMFRSETACMVALYSLKEKRMLFVNDVCKSNTGWPPEKFTHDFVSLLRQGKQEWENALSALTYQNESQCHLVIESDEGEEPLFQCLLGMIPRGVFKNNVVAILYEVG